jgi:hypothetical protein
MSENFRDMTENWVWMAAIDDATATRLLGYNVPMQ